MYTPNYFQAFVLVAIGITILIKSKLMIALMCEHKSHEKKIRNILYVLGVSFIFGGIFGATIGFSS